FRAQPAHVEIELAQQIERVRMHLPLGLTTRREGAESSLAGAIEDDLGHDRARRVPAAQEQYVEGALIVWRAHGSPLAASRLVGRDAAAAVLAQRVRKVARLGMAVA